MSTLEHEVVTETPVGEWGQIAVRFIVFKKEVAKTPATPRPDEPALDDDETEGAADEINSYLEASSRGRQHVVFLLSGQRHHGLDRGFIVHDLGKKYISKRTLITVELEGLSREAKTQLIQGSRSGFFEGPVFDAIKARLVGLLKRDPDLERLEEEAEEELSQLQASDEAVNQALDQLIDDHNPFGERETDGQGGAGVKPGATAGPGGKPTPVDVVIKGANGDPAGGPVLIGRNAPKTLRLRPNGAKQIHLSSEPPSAWESLEKLGWVMDPPFEEMKVTLDTSPTGAIVTMEYVSQAPDEEYPLETKLQLFAAFKGEKEPRLFEQNIVIKPPVDRPPPPAPVLRDEPTQLKLRSRKPIKLLTGDADRHVVLQWDGKDELVGGPAARWMLRVFCNSHSGFPAIVVTQPQNGRFQAIIPCPSDRATYPPGTTIILQAEAIGLTGKTLSIQFEAIIEEPKLPPDVGPRLQSALIPMTAGRRPNYRVMEIKLKDYGQECPWASAWDTTIAGALIEPTEKAPLTLLINVDHDLYRAFMDAKIKEKAAEATIKRHQTRYLAHLAYYLYQMYMAQQMLAKPSSGEGENTVADDQRSVQEINRVARMLVRLMPMMH